METERLTTSHSFWACWRTCRRKTALRYLDRLVPQAWPEKSEALSFGDLLDRALEQWNTGSDLEAVLVWLDTTTAGRWADAGLLDRYHRVRAAVRGYAARYPRGSEADLAPAFVGTQVPFHGPVVNPDTGKLSQRLDLGGVMDGLFADEETERLAVYELKSTGRLDGPYIEALWAAPQTGLYAAALEEATGELPGAVLYDIVEKPPAATKRREGETEAAFEARAAEARAKNKSGKTSVQRQEPETWEEFEERLIAGHYARKESFHRERILVTADRVLDVRRQLWLMAKDFLAARRDGSFFRNPSACRQWGGYQCEYLPICESGDDAGVIENLYRRQETEDKDNARTQVNTMITDF